MSNKSVIPSHKHCIKKLREIKELKKKKELNDEQREKISKEKSYLPGYVLIEASLVGEVEHVIKGIPKGRLPPTV